MEDLKIKKETLVRWAHDIRGPLSILKGYLKFSQYPMTEDDKEKYLQAANKALDKLQNIVEEVEVEIYPENHSQYIFKKTDEKEKTVKTTSGEQKVLLVDDDDSIRKQWRDFLEKQGVSVVELASGEELLQCSLDFSEINMAIIDFQFTNSELNGFDVIEYLKQKQVPEIHLCTGVGNDPEVRKKAMDLGVYSVIVKPIQDEAFQSVLETHS